MKRPAIIIVMALLSSGAPAQERAPAPGHGDRLLIAAVPGTSRLTVTTPAFADGGDFPRDATAYGANRFPGLRWTKGPKGTRSYVVVVQGVLQNGRTSIHLTLLDVPATTTSLPEGLSVPPPGATYGINVHGPVAAYTGPHTHGTARQPYHLQVAALDARLPTGSGGSFDALTAAMRGHVLATGEVTGYAAKPADVVEAPVPGAR